MNTSLSHLTRSLLNKHGFRIKKSLGQNFLTDPVALQRIVDAAEISKDDTVIEVGTGTGILTKELAKLAKRVISFEIDKKVIAVAIDYLVGCNNVEIVDRDFLDADLTDIGASKVVANVPYYITTPIIEKIVDHVRTGGRLSLAILTVQREFAERMTAKPGTKEYGSFTVFVNYHTEPEIIANIPRSSFLPQPDVSSSIIRLKIRKSPIVDVKDEELFFKVVRASFGQRRKTLRNCLISKFDVNKVDAALAAAGIDPKRRGETLSIREFAALADQLGSGC